jgi:hypothetical protein
MFAYRNFDIFFEIALLISGAYVSFTKKILYLIIKYARVPWFGSSVRRFAEKKPS